MLNRLKYRVFYQLIRIQQKKKIICFFNLLPLSSCSVQWRLSELLWRIIRRKGRRSRGRRGEKQEEQEDE